MIPFLDLKHQYQSIKAEVDEAVTKVLESGWFILGEQVAAFEEEFSAYVGARYGVGVGSGTEALHLALWALDVGPGDEVITVPNTAVATVAAIELTGARPVLVDIHPQSYNLDPEKLEAAITPRTKVVIPVHLYGQAADMDAISEIARRRGIFVVEDAAQAHGAEYKRQRVGSLGDIGCFSFYPTKNLGAYGDGGMVVTNNEATAKRLRLLRQYGWETRYQSSIRGTNSRLDEMQAAILRVKLKHLDEWNDMRRRLAQQYHKALSGSEVALPQEMPDSKHAYHLYVIKSPRRDELRTHLNARDIETQIHYPTPIHLQEAYSHLGYRKGSFPTAEAFSQEILSLPLYPELADKDLDTIATHVLEFSQR
jgi:dTDP-4-amino-4,6-dideoxygalactose transaminase